MPTFKTKEVARLYQMFPAAYRTNRWAEMQRLANSNYAGAVAMGREQERTYRRIRAENVVSRRLRIQRVALFTLFNRSEEQLEAIFKTISDELSDVVLDKADRPGNIPLLNRKINEAGVQLRRQLNKWVTDHIWFAIRLGFKNVGDAFEPIFLANKEAFQEDLQEQAVIEERLSFGITSDLAARGRPRITETNPKWKKVLDKIYSSLVKTNNRGLKPSERVWEITQTAQAQMKRLLVNEIAHGTPSRDIAKKLQKYLSPGVKGGEESTGPGVYKSPFKNAMRLARTEATRAYDTAVAEWSKDKRWVEGLRVVLSPSHVGPDECDELAEAGTIYSPDEIQDVLPVHPHCTCQPTPVMKDEYLALFTHDFTEG